MKRTIFFYFMVNLIAISCSKESNEGSQSFDWNLLTETFNVRLTQVDFITDEIGFIGGFSNDEYYFAKTTDTGNSWNKIELTPSNNYLQSWFKTIHFINDQIGFVVIDTFVFKTIDQGTTWTEINSENVYLDKFVFTDTNNGISYSSNYAGGICRTNDGGNTWTKFPPNSFPRALTSGDIFITDGVCNNNKFFISGKTGELYFSSDGGISWVLQNGQWIHDQQLSGNAPNIGGLFLNASDELYIFGENGIYKTLDDGQRFVLVNADAPNLSNGDGFGYLKVSYLSDNEIYLQGNNFIYKTDDYFKTLVPMSVEEDINNGLSTDVYDFEVLTSGKGFATGYLLNFKVNQEKGVVLTYQKE